MVGLAPRLATLLQGLLLLAAPVAAAPQPGPTFSYSYTTNPAGNTVGGIKPWATYTDNHLFGLQIPYTNALGASKGNLNFSFLSRNGQNLSAIAVGNQFTVQQIYGGQTIIYYALNVEAEFENANSTLRVGRMSTGDVFATDPIYWLYMNNAICGNPQSLIVNTNSGFTAYPTATWGGTFSKQLNSNSKLHLGAFQVANVDVTTTHGLDWTIGPNDGLFLIAQLDINRKIDNPTSQHITQGNQLNIPVGSRLKRAASALTPPTTETRGEIDTNAFAGIFLNLQPQQGFGRSPGTQSVHGGYLHVDRVIYREPLTSHQGLTAWASASLVPQSNVAKMPGQVNGGLIYTGLFPHRDNDLTMLGVFAGRFSPEYLGTTATAAQTPVPSMPGYELVIEIDHRFVLSPSTYIQPNIQVVVSPGGTGSLPTSLVVGVQAGFNF
jgi:porin